MRKVSFSTILLTVGLFLLGARSAAAAPLYTCLDLKKAMGPDVSGVYPAAIDAAGEVTGFAYPRLSSGAFPNRSAVRQPPGPALPNSGEEIPYAFLTGPFGIPIYLWFHPPTPNKGWEAQNISRDGKNMAGSWHDTDYKKHAWVAKRDSDSANWNLSLGGTSSWANAVNDAGQVVGAAYDASGNAKAFLYSGGVMQPLPTLPFSSGGEARDINNAGKVVGNSGHAFLYDGTIHDLGTLPPGGPGIGSDAYAINDAGQVVGDSGITIDPMPIYHAFLWDGGPEMKDLGTLPGGDNSRAYDINNAGQVVGYSTKASNIRAFLYTDGVMLDLNDLVVNLPAGVVLAFAYGINDRGQIIAGAANNTHGYLLTPVSAPPAANLLLLQ